jgi:hypothetical protein
MRGDVSAAFGVLAKHWGGDAISLRYDFLTLLRVIERYLPRPYVPRPTGSNWYYQVVNTVIPVGVAGRPTVCNVAASQLSIALSPAGMTISTTSDGPVSQAAVYDARGSLLKTIDAAAGGPASLHWDCRNEAGQPLAPGMYFVRARSGSAVLPAKAVFIP